jgi:hypothetical protein
MSKYPQPPFDTKDVLIVDTVNPEDSYESVVDLNDFSNEKLSELYFVHPVAKKLLDWRYENKVGFDEDENQDQKD